VDIVDAARRAATRVTFPGICLIISDFLYPLDQVSASIAAFRARNMEVHAVQILGESDLSPSPGSMGQTLVDSETGEPIGLSLDPTSRDRYTRALHDHIERIRHHCHSAQVQFVSTVAREPLADTSIDTLTHMGLFV
jgi:hypothetical protein